MRKLHDAKVEAVVHCGFGFGVVLVGFAMQALEWDPPRFMGTAFQNAWLNEIVWNAMVGWTGIDQYDAENQVGQEFLDRYSERFGRRPEWCVPVVNRDLAVVLLQAFAEARPLSPAGVRDALERVKMFPAASGAPGTRDLVRQVHAPWLDGPGLPRRPPTRPRRRERAHRRPLRRHLTPASSIPRSTHRRLTMTDRTTPQHETRLLIDGKLVDGEAGTFEVDQPGDRGGDRRRR